MISNRLGAPYTCWGPNIGTYGALVEEASAYSGGTHRPPVAITPESAVAQGVYANMPGGYAYRRNADGSYTIVEPSPTSVNVTVRPGSSSYNAIHAQVTAAAKAPMSEQSWTDWAWSWVGGSTPAAAPNPIANAIKQVPGAGAPLQQGPQPLRSGAYQAAYTSAPLAPYRVQEGIPSQLGLSRHGAGGMGAGESSVLPLLIGLGGGLILLALVSTMGGDRRDA